MANTKLHKMSRVSAQREMDTVARSKYETRGDDKRRGLNVLLEAQSYYSNMSAYREERRRNKRYCYGDQWGDKICYKGKMMTEEQYLMMQGNVPLKNNMIRRLVRNVIGVWRNQNTEPTCVARDRDEQKLGETMSTILQYNMQLNRMQEMYARSMEEFLISSLVVHKKWYGWRQDKNECWTDLVQPNNFFLDTHMRDYRGLDCSCLGEIHDVPFNDICKNFAHSPEDYKRLSEIYSVASNGAALQQCWEQFGVTNQPEPDFLVPNDSGRCRVIEVWRKESKPRWRCHDYNTGEVFKVDVEDYQQLVVAENRRRMKQAADVGMAMEEVPQIEAEWMIDDYWYYYYLTPTGEILSEGETPYMHKSHPYVFVAYPFIDGETHSFVADVIDQQKYVNRLVILYDWIMRASAKGVLLVPKDCIPKDMSPEDFAESWSTVNGVVVYQPSQTGATPQQISANSTNIGISEMLNLQLKFFEDISGVNGALQGKPGYAGMSAALYNQQTQNATTSLLDILDTFSSFTRDAAYKDVKNIQQFYDDKRIMNIAGKSGMAVDDTDGKIHDVEFDLSIVPSTATPAYRAMANDFLMEIWKSGQISLKQLLESGNFPFADQLLQSLEAQNAQMEQMQAQQQAQQQAQGQAQGQM